jgi:acyl-CoA thioesterase I
MMGSDMDDSGSRGTTTRRAWLAHCSALALLMAAAPATPVRAQGTATAKTPPGRTGATVLVLGDSLSAEYGLARGSGWVALLEQRLAREGIAAQVVNASISGETTSGGRSRLPALLAQHKPTLVVIELGGNDALRGLPLAMTRDNLTQMARLAKSAGAKVLIAGMQVPPNYGRKYGDEFFALFAEVAKVEGAALVPFLLEKVANAPNADALFQPDRIHPLAAAHPTILANVWPVLAPLLKRR